MNERNQTESYCASQKQIQHLQKGEQIIVTVECCQNCHAHQWLIKHSEQGFLDNFEIVKSELEKEFPRVLVLKNSIMSEIKQDSFTISSQDHVPYQAHDQQFQDIQCPRIGSFEIMVFQTTIFSKLNTQLWPHIPSLILSLRSCIADTAFKKMFQQQNVSPKPQNNTIWLPPIISNRNPNISQNSSFGFNINYEDNSSNQQNEFHQSPRIDHPSKSAKKDKHNDPQHLFQNKFRNNISQRSSFLNISQVSEEKKVNLLSSLPLSPKSSPLKILPSLLMENSFRRAQSPQRSIKYAQNNSSQNKNRSEERFKEGEVRIVKKILNSNQSRGNNNNLSPPPHPLIHLKKENKQISLHNLNPQLRQEESNLFLGETLSPEPHSLIENKIIKQDITPEKRQIQIKRQKDASPIQASPQRIRVLKITKNILISQKQNGDQDLKSSSFRDNKVEQEQDRQKEYQYFEVAENILQLITDTVGIYLQEIEKSAIDNTIAAL